MKRSLLRDYLVDGKEILAPDEGVSIGFSDLEADTARDESGFLHRIVSRYDMRTWGLSYSTLTVEEYNYVMGLFKGKSSFEFSVTKTDGTVETVNCYCSKKSVSYYSKRHGLYKDLSIEVVEC